MWSGVAGIILGWGIQTLWGKLPNPYYWLAIGGFLSFISFVGILFPTTNLKRFLWAIDRRMELKEQLSAAWDVAHLSETHPVHAWLVDDVLSLLSNVRKRMIFRGWALIRDLEAVVLVGLLGFIILLNNSLVIPSIPHAAAGIIPPLGEDPTVQNVFPSGIPGITPEEEEKFGLVSNNESETDDMSPDMLEGFEDLLDEFGEKLSSQAATYDLGQAIKKGDLKAAAEALEDLAGRIGDLSPQTKENMAEALEGASEQLPKPELRAISDNMDSAAQSLKEGNDSEAGEQLDKLAQQLRWLDEVIRNSSSSESEIMIEVDEESQETVGTGGEGGAGEGSGEEGLGDPESRVEGEGETFEFLAGEESGLLSPGTPEGEDGSGITSGTLDYVRISDASIIYETIHPYTLPWIKRNVVSTYFSTR
jgi:hypothetical protein